MERIGSSIKFLILTWFFILCAVPCLAKEGGVFRTQGLINSGGDLKSGYLLINETRVYVDKTTQVMDYRNTPLPVMELRPRRWVYMEIEKDSSQKNIRAKKIYLLPRYINPIEKQKFSFMN